MSLNEIKEKRSLNSKHFDKENGESVMDAHMFSTQGGDFSFPYRQSGNEVARCKAKVRKQIWKNELPKQKLPLSWLIEKFWPVKGWDEKSLAGLPKNLSSK